jgi:hypothetical protein
MRVSAWTYVQAYTRTAMPPVGSTTHHTFDSLQSLPKRLFIRRGASPTWAASQPRIAPLQRRKQSDDPQGDHDQEARAEESELLLLERAFHFTFIYAEWMSTR